MAYTDFLTTLNGLFRGDAANVALDLPSYSVIQHDINAVFEKIKELTAYKSRALSSEGKEFDKYAITNDEKNVVRQFLKAAAEEVFGKLGYLNKEIGRSMNFEEGPTAPLWDSGTTYTLGEIVSDGVDNYESVNGTGNTNKALTNNDYWEKLDTYGIPAYDATQTYAVGDYVKYNSKIWEKLTSAAAGTTPTEGTDWSECDPYSDILNKITFVLYNLKDQDLNMISVMSDKIYQLYVSYVMKEWYLMNNMGDDFKIQSENTEILLTKIKEFSFYRTKPMYRTRSII